MKVQNNQKILIILARGVLFWGLLMLVITASWYLASALGLFPGIELKDPLHQSHHDNFLLLGMVTIVFSIWISSLHHRWEQQATLLKTLKTSLTDSAETLEMAHQALDEQYQMLPVASLMLSDQLVIMRCNHAFMNLVNGNRESVAGRSIKDFVANASLANWPVIEGDILDESNSHPVQLEMVRKVAGLDNHFWVQLNKRINFDTYGDRQIFVSLTDISDRIYAEKSFQSSYQQLEKNILNQSSDLFEVNERMKLAANSAEMGIWDLDLGTGELVWDDWMYRLHDISRSSFNHTVSAWHGLVNDADRASVIRSWAQSIKKRLPLNNEFRISTRSGEDRWIKINALCKRNNDNVPVRMIGVCHDITSQKEKELIIRQQADYDDLTGLPNRKLFHELLTQEIKEARRDSYSVWLLFLDLDGFKEVNDTLGHHVGDLLLQKVAERLQALLRNADIVARLGGDEFVIILTDISEISSVDHICQKIIQSIGRVFRINNEEVYVTTSIGIASFPNDADNTTDLLKFADQAMYVSKEEGKNTFSYFTSALQAASLLRKDILQDLRAGIAENHFQLFYQPIIDLKTGQVTKAETLLRWQHPLKGIISPAAFIPIAEETGIIKDIGLWIFDHAFSQLQTWRPHLPENFQLSINMSPIQLKSTDQNMDDWFDQLGHYGLAGRHIVIEITEGLLLRNDDTVNERLMRYSNKGIQVAIDDFGTGYSSLSYLKEFDIDYLKIDQSFTQKISAESNEKALSHAIIVMAQQLGLKVIAEGIETPEQRDFLREMGCDYGQGYLFDRPLTADDFFKHYLRGDKQQASSAPISP